LGHRKNRYSKEFKADAVRLVQEGRSVASVAKDLGVNHQSLRNWIAKEKVKEDPI
jgi:transposase